MLSSNHQHRPGLLQDVVGQAGDVASGHLFFGRASKAAPDVATTVHEAPHIGEGQVAVQRQEVGHEEAAAGYSDDHLDVSREALGPGQHLVAQLGRRCESSPTQCSRTATACGEPSSLGAPPSPTPRQPAMASSIWDMRSSSSSASTSRAPRFSLSLFHLARPEDDGGHVGVGCAPGDGQLGEGAAEIVGHVPERLHLGVGLVVGDPVLQPAVALQPGPAVLGDAVRVLAGEQARRERAPSGEAEADVVVEPGVLLLHLPPLEEVVLRLLHHRLVQPEALGDPPGGSGSRRRSTPRSPSTAPCRTRPCRSWPAPSPSMGVRGSARWQNTRST